MIMSSAASVRQRRIEGATIALGSTRVIFYTALSFPGRAEALRTGYCLHVLSVENFCNVCYIEHSHLLNLFRCRRNGPCRSRLGSAGL
jgi:hypothetical protein